MQEEARLKPEQAEEYLREVREERLAAGIGAVRDSMIHLDTNYLTTEPGAGAVHGSTASSRRQRFVSGRKSQR